jgi:hypothetical protein
MNLPKVREALAKPSGIDSVVHNVRIGPTSKRAAWSGTRLPMRGDISGLISIRFETEKA